MNLLTKLFSFYMKNKSPAKVVRKPRTKRKIATAIVVAGGIAGAIHPAGLDLIKEFEGFRPNAYRDVVGVKTIGYGHTNMTKTFKFDMGDKWSKEYASSVLEKDLVQYRNTIDKQVTVPLTRCQLSVLTSWTYNVGGANTGRSTLVRELNKGNYKRVPRELLKWNRAGGKVWAGLTRRRQAEAKLWKTNCGGRK